MPLLFQSLSHGEIPFGFFNIETDMILLNNYFFFASDMADNVIRLAENDGGMSREQVWSVYILDRRSDREPDGRYQRGCFPGLYR